MNAVSLRNVLRFILLTTLLVTSSVSLSEQKIIESGDNSPGFSYSTDSDASEPIIQYRLHIDMLANIPDRQTISFYGDGRVEIHNPSYMKNAGDFQMLLSDAELFQLVRGLADDGLMDFDHNEAKDRVKTARKSMRDRGQLYEISDTVETVVEISLDEYQKNKSSEKIKDFSKQFRWKNLSHDAVRYEKDTGLNRAHDTVKRLQGFKYDRRLVRVVQP